MYNSFLRLGQKYGTTSGILIYVGKNTVMMGSVKHITHYFAAPAKMHGVTEDRLDRFLLGTPQDES